MSSKQSEGGLASQAREFIDWFRRRPMERRFFARVPAANIKDDPEHARVEGTDFVSDQSYFSIRLVEMCLANAGEYFRQFLPMCVHLCEYTQGGQPRVVPFVVSNDLLQRALEAAQAKDAGRVELRNTVVLDRRPVNADNLALFTGLFRVEHSDFAAALLDVLADVGAQVGVPSLAAGTELAKTVYSGLGKLFNLKGVECLLGMRDGRALTKSGYLVYAGRSDNGLDPQRLEMVEGRLRYRENSGRAAPLVGIDYCVIALEHIGALNSLSTMPFNRIWREDVMAALGARKDADADTAMRRLEAEIMTSVDLTETDQIAALAIYATRYEEWRNRLRPRANGDQTRAGSSRSASVQSKLGREELRQERLGNLPLAEALGRLAGALNTAQASMIEGELARDDPLLAHVRTAIDHQRVKQAGGVASFAGAMQAMRMPPAP